MRTFIGVPALGFGVAVITVLSIWSSPLSSQGLPPFLDPGGITRGGGGGGGVVGDVVGTIQNAAGGVLKTVETAGRNGVTNVINAGNSLMAVYAKSWRDTSEQAQRSFKDATDAIQAVARFAMNEARSDEAAMRRREQRFREGKVVDAMWQKGIEQARGTEQNFFAATQQSTVINQAAATAAAVYGGPAGAAAYASWSTYRATGDANQAMRAGILAAVMTQTGGGLESMPTGTMGELLQKAAVTGAAGGIAVAAAGGDEQAVRSAFLQSGGAVLIQGGVDKVKAYSPETNDAVALYQCVSANNVDCVSNATYELDKTTGRILTDGKGLPQISSRKLDSRQHVGTWNSVGSMSDRKRLDAILKISKLPKMDAIPVMKNEWVLTWTFGQKKTIPQNEPAVVLTYFGPTRPFTSTITYTDALKNMAYACPFNGFTRTVTSSVSADGCEAIYRKEGGVSQTVWRGQLHRERCAVETVAFVAHLANLGIPCAPK